MRNAPSGEAAQALQQMLVTIGGRDELDPARARTDVADTHREDFQFFGLAQPLEPFDRRDAAREEILAQSQVVEPGLLEAIEVDMVERHAPAMLLDHREGGAQDVLLAETEPGREPLDEAGLARTEIAYQPEQLSTLEHRGQT